MNPAPMQPLTRAASVPSLPKTLARRGVSPEPVSGRTLSLACGTTVRSRISGRGSGMKTTAKDEVRALLERLPDDASLNDIQYHIYVWQKIERGLEAIRKGNVIPHEEIEKRMARWLEK